MLARPLPPSALLRGAGFLLAVCALAAPIGCAQAPTPTPSGCQADSECVAPATCDKRQTPRVCVLPSTCVPACPAGQQCNPSSLSCEFASHPSAQVSSPVDNTLLGPSFEVQAQASAPGGVDALKVELRRAGAVLAGAPLTAPAGGGTTYLGTIGVPSGTESGGAQLVVVLTWTDSTQPVGSQTRSFESAAISVALDRAPPTLGTVVATTTWLGPANPTAAVAAVVTDTGGAGVNATSVKLTLVGVTPTKSYTGTAVAGNGYAFAVPATDLGVAAGTSATVSFTLEAADNVGNALAPVSNAAYTLKADFKKPALTLVADNTWHLASSSVAVTGTVAENESGTLSGASGVKLTPGTTAAPSTPIATGSFSGSGNFAATFDVNTQAVPADTEAALPFFVTVTDNAGNAETISGAVNVDNRGPQVSAITVTTPADATTGGRAFYKATGTDLVVTATITDVSSVVAPTLKVGSATCTATTCIAGVAGASNTYTFALPRSNGAGKAGDVPVQFVITAEDLMAGTSGISSAEKLRHQTQSAAVDVYFDTVAPTVTALAADPAWYPKKAGGTGANYTLPVTVTFSDAGAGINTTTMSLTVGALAVGSQTVAPTSCTATTCTFALPTSEAAAGVEAALSFTVQIFDRLGNVSTTPTTSAKNFDDKAPTITSTTAPNSATWFGPGANIPVTVVFADSGAGFAGSTAKLKSPSSSVTAGYTGVVSGNSVAFSIPANDLVTSGNANPAIAFTVEASDAAGNPSGALTNVNVLKVDRKPPVLTPTADATWHAATATVSFVGGATEAESGLTGGLASVKLNPGTTSSTTGQVTGTITGATYSVPYNLSTLTLTNVEGAQSFFLALTDTAGNAATSVVTINVDNKKPTLDSLVATTNAVANSNGYYARTATPKVPVAVSATDGTALNPGSGVATATLTVNGNTVNSTTGPTGTPPAKSFTFDVDPTLAAAGTEGNVTITATATDGVGNQSAAGSAATTTFKVDDLGPAISAIVINGRDATVSSLAYFKQLDDSRNDTLADIDVQATIVDAGSGVKSAPKLVLQSNPATRVDTGTVAKDPDPSNVWHFKIKRVSAALIASGAQGTVAFKVIATDNFDNAQQADTVSNVSIATVGIDGQLPTITFSMSGQYPAASTGCDTTGAILCGHDGNRFWRQGDDGALLKFTGNDGAGGSGVPSQGSVATCAIPGNGSCTVTYSATNSDFEFVFNPSTVTFASDVNGEGSVSVSVSVKDAVGNISTTSVVPVAISRLKWVRSLSAQFNQIRSAPILTPPLSGGTAALLVAGTAGPNVDPIAQLSTTGAVVGTIGKNASISVAITSNMAYSPTTNLLYAITSLSSMQSFSVAAGGLANQATCDLTGSETQFAPGLALIGTTLATERVLVSDAFTANHALYALKATASTCGQAVPIPVSVGTGRLGPPSTDGSTVYLTYQGRGLAKVSYNGSFGTPVTTDIATVGLLGPVVPLSSAVFVAGRVVYKSYSGDFVTNNWLAAGASAGSMNDIVTTSPVVHGGLVFGSADTGDGFLRAFASLTGTEVFTYPTGEVISAVAIGKEATPTYYFTSGNGELIAIQKPAGSTAALAPGWTAKLKLTAPMGGASQGFTGVATEPTIGTDGTLYFGADNGKVYAILTDAGGTVAPSASNWPRVGFDNCNSGNSSYTNCP